MLICISCPSGKRGRMGKLAVDEVVALLPANLSLMKTEFLEYENFRSPWRAPVQLLLQNTKQGLRRKAIGLEC